MRAFFKKRFIKWSMISSLGISAYFIGFSIGTKELGKEIAHQAFEAHLANLRLKNEQKLARHDHRRPANDRYLNDTALNDAHVYESMLFLPTSEQTADLSQTK